MSRTVRTQLLSIVDLLKKANKILESRVLKPGADEEEITGLLADCQDSAIAMGNKMEAAYGDGMPSVEELEKYCETLYQIMISLQDKGKCRELLREQAKQVKRLRRLIGTDIPDKLEVVFLPYKASMWDSLESIWFAARDDKESESYVIPIPYYDRNPDGSVREEHYEGDAFPSYVPVTGYREYNFEERQPDIIFIHNPYDNGNYVTSVHPFFYSENLKKFTEKLVYVPYFISDGNGISEAFAVNAGVRNADYIIVQNEKEKEDYVRNFKKYASGFDISDKVLPLGSPKLDKVRSLSRENVNAPKEWLEKVEGKKVIFYNTSLSALLKGNEQYLKKLEDVFRVFQGRKDMVLLWRPHPLMESSLLSMRPALHGWYMELKRQFLEEGTGIYDDTPDMYTAIGLSDAYYGDRSSLVWLYQQTGKPVMIQDTDIIYQ